MTNSAKHLGYAGSAIIGNSSGDANPTQVLVTGGSASSVVSPSYLQPINIYPTATAGRPEISRSKVLHGDGVYNITGSVNFDVTSDAMALFVTTKLFQRAWRPTAGTGFTLGIFDGERGSRLDNCYVTSLSLSGSPGGLISCSLAVMSGGVPTSDDSLVHSYVLTDTPYGYWWSGNTDVRDWTLNFTQDVAPVYYNAATAPMPPRYLRIGMITATLDVSTYDVLHTYDAVTIVTKSFTLKGVTTLRGHTYGGQTDLGTHQHTFETASDATIGSDDPVLTIV